MKEEVFPRQRCGDMGRDYAIGCCNDCKHCSDRCIAELCRRETRAFPQVESLYRQAEWSDRKARFVLTVKQGTAASPFVGEIAISNKTASVLTLPTPFVMPLCGDTNKNNLRVYDNDGEELEMDGLHVDWSGRPAVGIPANLTGVWGFELDWTFPKMAEPGTYAVEFWYFATWSDETTWQGRVRMDRLVVVRRVDGPLRRPAAFRLTPSLSCRVDNAAERLDMPPPPVRPSRRAVER